MYLTGISIDCLAVLILSGLLGYNYVKKKPSVGLGFTKPIIGLIVSGCLISTYFLYKGDLMLASVIVWVQAVAVIATTLFILLIIIFKPDWK